MAREVVTTISNWCDICLRVDGTRTLATFDEVIEIAALRRQLMLCDAHFDKLMLRELEETLSAYGDKVLHPTTHKPTTTASGRAKIGSGDQACPVPGCGKAYVGRSALADHVRRVHHSTLNEIGLPANRTRATEATRPCPVAGCSYVGKSGGGLASHLRSHTEEEQAAAQEILGVGWGGTK